MWLCVCCPALLSHILYLGAYAYTQTMIFLTLKRESSALWRRPCLCCGSISRPIPLAVSL